MLIQSAKWTLLFEDERISAAIMILPRDVIPLNINEHKSQLNQQHLKAISTIRSNEKGGCGYGSCGSKPLKKKYYFREV